MQEAFHQYIHVFNYSYIHKNYSYIHKMFILISPIKIKFRMGNLLFLFISQVLSGRNDKIIEQYGPIEKDQKADF